MITPRDANHNELDDEIEIEDETQRPLKSRKSEHSDSDAAEVLSSDAESKHLSDVTVCFRHS